MNNPNQYNRLSLDEDFLKKLEQLSILGNKKVQGRQIGEHVSWKSGGSLEFQDYRRYEPGDDLRYVDWNIFGRTDRLYVKQFQAEKDLAVYILVDISKSMEFGEPKKIDYALKLAASLSYIGLKQLDRVGLVSFNKRIDKLKLAQKGKRTFLSLLDFLSQLIPAEETDINGALFEFVSQIKQPGFVVVLSDLLDTQGVERGIKTLNYGKHQGAFIQILAPQELRPDSVGFAKLEDLETEHKKSFTITQETIHAYQEQLNKNINIFKNLCLENGFSYSLADTSVPFQEFVLTLLSSRLLNN